MNFENSFSENKKNILEKEEELSPEQELREKEKALLDFCEKNNNPIVILESGKVIDTDLKLSKYWQNLPDIDKDIAEMLLIRANEFLNSPLFTDSFHEDHGKRRSWEDKYAESQMSPDLLEYYASNRLNLNRLSLPFSFKAWFETLNKNVVDNLSAVTLNSLQKELDKLTVQDLHKYGLASDQEKIEIVRNFENIFKKIVTLLSSD
ncbi:MAG: hypothetical protein RBT30_02775 [Patescibacteria group bacterium]|jgi:hypothetical protein|nr:hypothetical protein [Patescibacteria group bacterium]